jgi:hypothetical protein
MNNNNDNVGGKPKSAIPDRWLDYKAIGSVVACFIPFKVPLHQVFAYQIKTHFA